VNERSWLCRILSLLLFPGTEHVGNATATGNSADRYHQRGLYTFWVNQQAQQATKDPRVISQRRNDLYICTRGIEDSQQYPGLPLPLVHLSQTEQKPRQQPFISIP